MMSWIPDRKGGQKSVVVDAICSVIHMIWLDIIEDGGEHLKVSCTLWIVLRHVNIDMTKRG
jgi:hypothetical protein